MAPDLVSSLRRALDLEAMVDRQTEVVRWRRACEATGALMLAAFEAGWSAVEIAAALDWPAQRVRKRIERARRRLGGHSPALIVDEPLPERPRPRAVLLLPLEQRAWLTRQEAADLAGVYPGTIRNWYAAGLLPHTDDSTAPHLILRGDVMRVMRADRYRDKGVHYATLRADLST